jgi:hypothetical protein
MGDILRALATACAQNAKKNAFGPKKTRFKKSLIIAVNAVIYQKSNPWVEPVRDAILRGVAIWRNSQANQRYSALTHP